MGGCNRFYPLGRKVVSLKRHNVDAPRTGWNSFHQHEWRHIVQGAAQGADETVAANRYELMDRNASENRGMIVDMYMASQQRAVCDQDVISQLAVMRRFLEEAGFRVLVATDGVEAVEQFGREEVEVGQPGAEVHLHRDGRRRGAGLLRSRPRRVVDDGARTGRKAIGHPAANNPRWCPWQN